MQNVVKCPMCLSGYLKEQTVKNYNAGVLGIIPDAKFMTCDTCGEQILSAKEAKRWELMEKSNISVAKRELKVYLTDKQEALLRAAIMNLDTEDIEALELQTLINSQLQNRSNINLTVRM